MIPLKDGFRVVIGKRRPDAVLPASIPATFQPKPGQCTVRDIIPPGEPFPPGKMWRYYKIEPNDPKYAGLQAAKPFARVILQYDERKAVMKKRFGKDHEAQTSVYAVFPEQIYQAFCYESTDQT